MISKIRLFFTGTLTLLIWAHLGWDYFHEGVPSHTILIFESLPRISNWWGGIVLPLLTWFLLYRIQYRTNEKNNESTVKNNLRTAVYGFLSALVFGIVFSIFFTDGYLADGSDLPAFVMIGLILVSFFSPLYHAEHFLGFVIGMTYTFGPILPIGIGIILMILFVVTYKFIRTGILYIASIIRG